MIFSKFPLGTKVYTDQVKSFTAAVVANAPGSIKLTWTNPTSKKYVGTMVRCSESGYPASPTEGSLIMYGTGSQYTVNGLTPGKIYYFRAFARATNKSGSREYFNTITTGAQSAIASCPSPVTGLVATPLSSTSVRISWNAPTGTYTSVMIRYKTGSYPTSPVDGTQAYKSTGTSVDVTGLTAGTTYYFRAFVVNGTIYNTNTSGQQVNTATKVSAGQLVFTSSQTWTVPAGIKLIDVFCVGGGGSGGSYPNGRKGSNATGGIYNGAGGNGGFTKSGFNISVTPGQQLPVVVGAGGAPVTSAFPYYQYGGTFTPRYGAVGNAGGTSSCAGVSAAGGAGGIYDGREGNGGRGGSGGGGMYATGGIDGADGNVSGAAYYYHGNGYGQGTTTRAFGEAGNTLYSGGGGGCGAGAVAGGGAAGFDGYNGDAAWFPVADSGGANTGGGGGGITAGGCNNYGECYQTSGAGGSGVVIVRWAEQ